MSTTKEVVSGCPEYTVNVSPGVYKCMTEVEYKEFQSQRYPGDGSYTPWIVLGFIVVIAAIVAALYLRGSDGGEGW